MDNACQRLGNVKKSIYDDIWNPFKNLISPNVPYTLFRIVPAKQLKFHSSFIYGDILLHCNLNKIIRLTADLLPENINFNLKPFIYE